MGDDLLNLKQRFYIALADYQIRDL